MFQKSFLPLSGYLLVTKPDVLFMPNMPQKHLLHVFFPTELVSLSDLSISSNINIPPPKSWKSTSIQRYAEYCVHLPCYFKISYLLTKLHIQVPGLAYFGPKNYCLYWTTCKRERLFLCSCS